MDMRELRRIACQGVPDSAGIRSTLWKVPFLFQSVSSLVLVRIIDVREWNIISSNKVFIRVGVESLLPCFICYGWKCSDGGLMMLSK